MTTDARLNVGLATHPKTIRLERALGAEGFRGIVCLIMWTAQHRPTGDLSGLADEDLEHAVGWRGKAGALMATLRSVGFVDGPTEASKMHDWAVHQPWVLGAPERSRAATFAGLVSRYGKRKARILLKERETTEPQRPVDDLFQRHNSVSSPSPSPTETSKATDFPATAGQAAINGHGKPKTPGALVWDAYAAAYHKRHGVTPVPAATERGICANFAKKFPVDEAVSIAAFYPTHNGLIYVRDRHPLNLLMRDAQKIRTDMITGQQPGATHEQSTTGRRPSIADESERVLRVLGAHPDDPG